MSSIILEGIFYTLDINNYEAFVGNDSEINSNAISGEFKSDLVLPETFSYNSNIN